MSSDRELTHIVRSWMREGVNVLPDRVLDDVLAELPVTPQRRPWWHAWRTYLMNSTMKFAAAGAVALVVAVVGLAVYFSRPAVVPAATPSPLQSTAVSDPPSTQPDVNPPTTAPTTSPLISTQPTSPAAEKAPFVVFLSKPPQGSETGTPGDLWAMRSDGTDAQMIFPRLVFPSVAWSQDGTQLLVNTEDVNGVSHVLIADVADSIGPFVDTGFSTGADTACHGKSREAFPCRSSAFSMAPDGDRVVFAQWCTTSGPWCSFLSILDLRSGALIELTETLDSGLGRLQHQRFHISSTSWSPDGTTIAFVRERGPRVTGETGEPPLSNLYLIDADGRNLRQIDMGGLSVAGPRWSPDSTTIAIAAGRVSDSEPERDIYTVRPDGSELRHLTPEGFNPGLIYCCPEWTSSEMLRVRTDGYTFSNLHVPGAAIVPYTIDLTDGLEAIAPYGPGYSTDFFWQPSV